MVGFMRYYHNKSIQLLFLGRVDIMMKFVVFLDVDGVLNTRTTVKRTPSDYTGIDDAKLIFGIIWETNCWTSERK